MATMLDLMGEREMLTKDRAEELLKSIKGREEQIEEVSGEHGTWFAEQRMPSSPRREQVSLSFYPGR